MGIRVTGMMTQSSFKKAFLNQYKFTSMDLATILLSTTPWANAGGAIGAGLAAIGAVSSASPHLKLVAALLRSSLRA